MRARWSPRRWSGPRHRARDTRSVSGRARSTDRGRFPSARISPTTAAWPAPPAWRRESRSTEWPSTTPRRNGGDRAALERHLADEIVDADLLRGLHHAVDLDRPRPQLERLRRLADALARAELVEIVVAGIDLLVGDRPIERVFFITAGGIEVLGRVRQVADALRERNLGRQRQRG